MKSPLEISPNKLIVIVFIFALFIIPILLIILGIKFNPIYVGLAIGICLVIFFFLIYPRITKNKEFISQMKESKKMQQEIRKFPDLYKIKIAKIIFFFCIIAKDILN